MALVAFVLPDRWLPRLPEVAEHHLVVLQQSRARVLRLAREARPLDGSEQERLILHDFLGLVFPMVNRVVPEFLDALRNGIHEGLRELIAKERAAADTELQLALRHLEHAVNTFGVLIESWASLFRSLPQASLRSMMTFHPLASSALSAMKARWSSGTSSSA